MSFLDIPRGPPYRDIWWHSRPQSPLEPEAEKLGKPSGEPWENLWGKYGVPEGFSRENMDYLWGKYGLPVGKTCCFFFSDLEWDLYHLMSTSKKMWKISMLFEWGNSRHFDWAMFNSYVTNYQRVNVRLNHGFLWGACLKSREGPMV